MPIYEYVCDQCGHEFEEIQKFNDPHLDTCPECSGQTVQRKVSKSAFHLKGGGWYKDGYSSTASASSSSSKTPSGSKTPVSCPAAANGTCPAAAA